MISEKAATALATIATVCWCVQLIPQIIYNWKKKDCTGLPPLMMFLWVVSGIPFAIYFCVSKGNVILQVQPHLFMFFCSISFVQSCYYPPISMARSKIVMIVAAIIAADVGMEVGFILWLRPLYEKGVKWPDLIFGISASVLLAVGLLPPYFELAKRNGRVIGINFAFSYSSGFIGAWLSIMSVILGNMDIRVRLYSIVAGMELGIFCVSFHMVV
ncbi:CFF_HP2_G0008250.mRNA.1.CDS.1 [Saccharomyces cerevisiae]|nr:CFF_HP2_G0008250.mRNA.1.CDS.1 [Saccharomyces cerevisiae]CAI6411109.1 CFF_HP2_G0008250.mRNA.1.CDS.1 [Saccharomyces cerevisiae]